MGDIIFTPDPNASRREKGEQALLLEEMRRDYARISDIYGAAIREINARLETLASEFSYRSYHNKHNPIHHMQSRIKSLPSIVKKLQDNGIPPSMTNAKKNLHDIAGVRVICRYVEDIYNLANLLLSQDDILLINEKDYIRNPKSNGYRSLHIVVDVPVYMIEGRLFIPVEIQIRTVAMDFWATLEHGLRYKAMGEVPQAIVDQLRECADVITDTDYKMQDIFHALQKVTDRDDESGQDEI